MDIIKDLLKGIVIGVSNVIPGVSGGTMAVVFGIYDRLIGAVTGFFKDWKKNIIFLGTLAIGAVIGIIAFSNIITILLEKYPEQTNFFFIGLIIGTAPLLYKKATETKVKSSNYIWCVIAFAVVCLMGVMGDPNTNSEIIRELSGINIFKMFLAGFVAAATMILPGVSGSFVLLLLGLYETMTTAVKEFNIPLLIVVAIGVMLGFLLMTKIIDTLFKKYPQTAYFIILGLVVGSVFAIYPGFTLSLTGVVSIVCLACGFGIAYVIGEKEA